MLKLVLRQLQADPVRTALTSLALAAVIAVILIFEGFLEGVVEQSRDAVMNRGADLIVRQAGIKNLMLARSLLPQSARSEVEAVDGVVAAYPLTGIPVIYEQSGVSAPLLLLVYDTNGGPLRIAAGRAISGPREIVVDRSFAKKFDLAPGDPLVISDFEFTIAGMTEGAAAFFSAFGYARYDDLIDSYFESDLAADISTFPLLSFLLVDVADESNPADVAAEIERAVPSGDVFLPSQIADEDEALAPILSDGALYESSKGDNHTDWALRWSDSHGNWDLGASAFFDTSREPRLVPTLIGLRKDSFLSVRLARYF
jgi:putative ABC transport system permease protein